MSNLIERIKEVEEDIKYCIEALPPGVREYILLNNFLQISDEVKKNGVIIHFSDMEGVYPIEPRQD